MSKSKKNEEDKLQASIVMWFGQKWPEYQQLLFEVNNNPVNIKHAMHRRSMGMRAGVADLILIQPDYGVCCGIELKAPGSSYSYSEIEHQLKWGENSIDNGGYYIMSSDIELIKEFIEAVIDDNIFLIPECEILAKKHINDQLEKRKTIKF